MAVLLSIPTGITIGSGTKINLTNSLLQHIWSNDHPSGAAATAPRHWGSLLSDAGLTKVTGTPGRQPVHRRWRQHRRRQAIDPAGAQLGLRHELHVQGVLERVWGRHLPVVVRHRRRQVAGRDQEHRQHRRVAAGRRHHRAAGIGRLCEPGRRRHAVSGIHQRGPDHDNRRDASDPLRRRSSPTRADRRCSSPARRAAPWARPTFTSATTSTSTAPTPSLVGHWTVPLSGSTFQPTGTWGGTLADDPDVYDHDVTNGVKTDFYPIVAATYDLGWTSYSEAGSNLVGDFGGTAADAMAAGNTARELPGLPSDQAGTDGPVDCPALLRASCRPRSTATRPRRPQRRFVP